MMVTTPIVARLIGRSRVSVRHYTLAGRFGAYSNGDRGELLVKLAAVEKYAGRKFTPEQLAAASRGATIPSEPMETT